MNGKSEKIIKKSEEPTKKKKPEVRERNSKKSLGLSQPEVGQS